MITNTDNTETRRMVEQCYRTSKTLLNPVIDWMNDDIWEFIEIERVSYCGLYDDGFDRLGCIGCPNSNQCSEFKIWPAYRNLYLKSFEKMLIERKNRDLKTVWGSPDEVMDWWTGKRKKKQTDGQVEMELSEI